MSLRITCPNCDTSFNVADTLRGKNVRCKKCQDVFLARENRMPDEEEEPEVQPVDERQIQTKPRPASPAAVRRRAARNEEDEEETPKRRPRKSAEDEERQGSSVALIAGAVGGGLLLLAGVIVLVVFLVTRKTEPATQVAARPNQQAIPAPPANPGQPANPIQPVNPPQPANPMQPVNPPQPVNPNPNPQRPVQTAPAGAGRTRMVGGAFGRDPFRDAAPVGALLVGLEVGLGKFFDLDMVHSVRAIFRAGDKESLGAQHGSDLQRVTRLVAKPGYAVGAMTVRFGGNADGLSLTFMRINGDRLDPNDAYQSDWIGDTRPTQQTVLLTGEGRPIVGLFGTTGKDTSGLGLLLDRESKDDFVAHPNPPRTPDGGNKQPGERPAERPPTLQGNEFTPKNGMYTLTLPAAQRTSSRTQVLTIGGHKCPIESARAVLADGTTFVGASIGIPAVMMRELPAGQRFDTLRDAIVKSMNGRVVAEKDVMQDPVPGKEYQIEMPAGAARMQIYTIAGWVVYGVVEGRTREQVNSPQADTFYQSFKLTDKAKETFQKVRR